MQLVPSNLTQLLIICYMNAVVKNTVNYSGYIYSLSNMGNEGRWGVVVCGVE